MPQDKDEMLRQQDDFWDIASLMPCTLKRASDMRTERSVEATAAVEIELPIPSAEPCEAVHDSSLDMSAVDLHRTANRSRPADPTLDQNRLVDDYCPKHPLIQRVRVYDIPSEYKYYEQFLDHARRIRGLHGHPCSPVPFFSYVPEYSQLTRAQLDWYLWWREQVWQGKYPDVDYSYILLYAGELINTGGHSSPEWGQQQLCGLWQAYHNEYRRLNWLMAEWICDFSLIWHVPAPSMPQELIDSCSMKEFYLTYDGRPDTFCRSLVTYCSNGGYKTSKFASGDAKSICDKHIPAALNEALRSVYGGDGQLPLGGVLGSCSRVRVAYAGVLCTYQCRKKLLVDYYCLSQAHALKMMITTAAKYAENKLRAYFGVRSRLGIKAIDERVKAAIDAYFERELPMRKRPRPQLVRPDYERLYDAPRAVLSPEAAERIERDSWQTTERLIEAFEEDTSPDDTDEPTAASPLTMPPSAPSPLLDSTANMPDTAGIHAAFGEYMELLRLVNDGDIAGQYEFAKKNGQMLDSVFDNINDISMDIFGDVILIESGDGISIVDEYREELGL